MHRVAQRWDLCKVPKIDCNHHLIEVHLKETQLIICEFLWEVLSQFSLVEWDHR